MRCRSVIRRLLTAASAADLARTGPAVSLTDEAWVRDRRVARLEYRPFQVQSGGAVGQWHQQVRVALRFSTVPAIVPALTAQPAEAAALAGQLLNAEQARGWQAAALPSGLIRDPFADAPGTPTGPRFESRDRSRWPIPTDCRGFTLDRVRSHRSRSAQPAAHQPGPGHSHTHPG